MPYVPVVQRDCAPIFTRPAINMGELTYQLTCVIQHYLIEHGLRYQQIGEIKGALLGAYDDFQDRVGMPYEAQKAAENGDVWAPLKKAGLIP